MPLVETRLMSSPKDGGGAVFVDAQNHPEGASATSLVVAHRLIPGKYHMSRELPFLRD